MLQSNAYLIKKGFRMLKTTLYEQSTIIYLFIVHRQFPKEPAYDSAKQNWKFILDTVVK